MNRTSPCVSLSPCGVCVESCPVGAISMEPKARIDDRGCIECLCCMELCPRDAVFEGAPVLLRSLRKAKSLFKNCLRTR